MSGAHSLLIESSLKCLMYTSCMKHKTVPPVVGPSVGGPGEGGPMVGGPTEGGPTEGGPGLGAVGPIGPPWSEGKVTASYEIT